MLHRSADYSYPLQNPFSTTWNGLGGVPLSCCQNSLCQEDDNPKVRMALQWKGFDPGANAAQVTARYFTVTF